MDEAIEVPKKMGFADKGTFEIYQIIKNEIPNFDEQLVREFANEQAQRILSKIYIGWQEVPQEYNRFKADMELLSVNPKYESLNLDIDGPLGDALMNSILQNFSLN